MKENLINDTVQRAWDINPATVYGFLVGFLVLALVFTVWQLIRAQKALMDMSRDNIEILKDLNTSLLLLKEEGVQLSGVIKEHFNFTREHIDRLMKKYNP